MEEGNATEADPRPDCGESFHKEIGANEERESSTETMQSGTEALVTMDGGMQRRTTELVALNDDLNNVFASAQLALVILTREMRLRRFTPMAARMLDLNSADLGRPLPDLKLSLTIPELEPLLREVMDSNAHRDCEVQDSHGRWCSLRVRPYVTHDQKVEGAVMMLVDGDTAHRAHDLAQSIVSNVRGLLVVLDATLRVRSASPAFYKHFHVIPAQTEGRHVYQLGNGQWEIPELRTLLEEMLPRMHEVNDYELKHTFEGLGRRLIMLNARRLAQAPDTEPMVILSLEDITEREEATRRVLTSEENLRFSQEAAHIGSFDWNFKTGETAWSQELERLYGVGTGEFPQTEEAWQKLVHPDDWEGAIGAVQRAIETTELIEHEWRVTWPDGSLHWLAGRFQVYKDEEGEAVRLTGVSLDITERKQMEEALRERADALTRADRNKDEFLAMLAHELRNPLAPLRNATEILAVPEIHPGNHAQARRIMLRQIENMARMLDDLLDVSRLTGGRIELRKEPLSLESVLTNAVSAVRSASADRRQRLTLSLPSEPVYLEGDATRLEQIFGNLLGNAIKYGGEDCCIDMAAEREDPADPASPFVVVRIKDDGPGIAPELLPHVFDLFVQASRTLDREHGGLGIGLTLVNRLVELHGGSVEAYSEGSGRGSEFIVRLPILPEAPAPTQQEHPPASAGQPRRILIVDDNTDSAQTLAIIQQQRGHQTYTAATGPEAVATAAEFLPEIVLLDIGLPCMDGFEVARHLRAMPALENLLLIAMSGYGRKEDREEATLAGFDHYLVKPIDLAKLCRWIDEYATSVR